MRTQLASSTATGLVGRRQGLAGNEAFLVYEESGFSLGTKELKFPTAGERGRHSGLLFPEVKAGLG